MEGQTAVEYTAQQVAQAFLNSLDFCMADKRRICEVLELGLTNKLTKKFSRYIITVTVEPQVYSDTIYPSMISSVTESLKLLDKNNEQINSNI